VFIFAAMQNNLTAWQDTIVAQATGNAAAAIAIIRLSGQKSIEIAQQLCPSKDLSQKASHSAIFCNIVVQGKTIDEAVVILYKAPKSYTGEDIVEISCHGSSFIISTIINACLKFGARLAKPGEFTQRAFLQHKLDLSQAEAVADLIASENEAQHKIALEQLRGGYSKTLQALREKLINFAALIELELDFSEEDVQFANRQELNKLLQELRLELSSMANSFSAGNAIKKGIPVAIIGKPNAGKSTLLNILLNDDKAIVSEIAGTTRDAIEDVININGIAYRFIDTAGIRQATDEIEKIGIEKTFKKTKEASIVILVVDASETLEDITGQIKSINLSDKQTLLVVINKIDAFGVCNGYDVEEAIATLTNYKTIAISAKDKLHTEKLPVLIDELSNKFKANEANITVSNIRHFEAINNTLACIQEIENGLAQNLTGDLLTIDIRRALQQLGSITGQVEIDKDILGTIFGKFCIGK
jgi:tRNA modification GTPase